MNFLKNNYAELLALTFDHLLLVLAATIIAVSIGIPVGIWLTRHKAWQRVVLGITNVLQTVPSLALFGLLIPLPFIGGIGARTAIIALVLYALLPIVRNTVTGIEAVDRDLREAATALGMTDKQILWQLELPLASKIILAGVRVATVISVGVATIAAAIGASGLGTYIFRGVRMNDNTLILAGAIPAALLALAADWSINRIEKSIDVNRRGRFTSGVISDATQVANDSINKRRRLLAFGGIGCAVALLIGGALWRRGSDLIDGNQAARVRVGSKDFTESLILAEIVAQELEREGVRIERRFELGGNLCHDALVSNRIDVYPEYTGTQLMAILHEPPDTDARRVYQKVQAEYERRFDIEMSRSLGYSNDFAILVRGDEARARNLKTISDVAPFAREWRAGFGQDFTSRPDGYEGFRRAYDLQFRERPREMDLSLTYRALANGEVDLIAGNSTDGLIASLNLVQLEDDKHYFPPYEAVLLARRDAIERAPALRRVMERLAHTISTDDMRRLNFAVDGEKRIVAEVARAWRASKGW